MGPRQLSTTVLQRSSDENSIKMRLESVNELINQQDNILIAVRTQLKKYQDMEKIFSSFLESDIKEQRINDIILPKTSLENFEIEFRHENERGFYLKIKNYRNGIKSLPPVFINKLHKKKIIECGTIELMKQSSKFNDIVTEISNLNNTIIKDLHSEITDYVPILFMISESVVLLDVLCGFAYFTSIQKKSYICPEFGKNIHIKNSLYLKQVAYLSIMAQIGCFLPCEYGEFKIFNSIRTRISCDDTEINASSFSKQMMEVVSILNNLDNDSLIIFDKLGRGSSFNDGFSICFAVLEIFQ
ncbi:unnamed protein product [Candida verbasci]|uniref:DNA mismatch repair proteins mutS family domain-containing protein n=1 Tax=Candida verbasci TaxID=1227364 RepID=A0A9W4TTC5_9ASCO|nr:unnamed protein product [Candida verbasci]